MLNWTVLLTGSTGSSVALASDNKGDGVERRRVLFNGRAPADRVIRVGGVVTGAFSAGSTGVEGAPADLVILVQSVIAPADEVLEATGPGDGTPVGIVDEER